MLFNSAREIIFRFLAFIPDIEISRNAIFEVLKFDVAQTLMVASAYQSIPKNVLLIIENNSGAIGEFTDFVPTDVQIDLVKIGLDREN